MALSDIIGQNKAVAILTGILERKRPAGSYIFSGESGIGKKLAAINFVKALNCLGKGSGPDYPADSCDTCGSCRKIDQTSHPDLLLVSPEDRQIKIDEIRLIDAALSFRPFEGRKKVVIVDDADTMNISSANAFLKTLEEPPEDSIIILISSRPDRLPATIRSRCSRVNFVTLSPDACKEVLRGKVPEESLESLARLSMGKPGLAASVDLRDEAAWFSSLLKAMLNSEKDSWASREEMDRWFDYLLTMMRDAAVFRVTGQADQLVNPDLGEYACRIGKSMELTVIIEMHKELSLLKERLMFNLNKSITWNYTGSCLRKGLVF
jgi:DNA polymerase III subunit delta'